MNIKSYTINAKRGSTFSALFNIASVYKVFPNFNIETDGDIHFIVKENSKSETTLIDMFINSGVVVNNYDKTISLVIPNSIIDSLVTTKYYYELYMIYDNNKYVLTYGDIYMQG